MNISLPGRSASSRSERPGVPSGGFNFIAARLERRRRLRQQRALLVIVFTIVVSGALFLGTQARLDTPPWEQRALSAEDRSQRLTEVYQSTLGVTGTDTLPAHRATRNSEIGTATAVGIDPGPLVAAIVAAAPAGVEVTQVSVASAAPAAPEQGEAPTAPATPAADPLAPPQGGVPGAAPTLPGPTAAAPGQLTVTIQASAAGYSEVEQFEQAVAAVTGLTGVTLEFSGTPPEMRLTITAAVDPVAYRPARLDGLQGAG